MRKFFLIDGPSGAGKTTYALRLGSDTGIKVVHLDDFYPGWSGLEEASRMVADDVLHPTRPGYRTWDWENDWPGEWVSLDPEGSLIIEGVGAVTARNIAAARRLGEVETIRITAGEQERKDRALRRDPFYADYWDMWAQQERKFFAGAGRVSVDKLLRW